jgi:hypothetical protein
VTAAQRRTATIIIGGDGHQVTITADVTDPATLTALAEKTYNNTRPAARAGIGFGSQLSQIRGDRQVGGDPLYQFSNRPVEARYDRSEPA